LTNRKEPPEQFPHPVDLDSRELFYPRGLLMIVADLDPLLLRGSYTESIRAMLLNVFDYLGPLDFAEPCTATQRWITSANAAELSLNKLLKQGQLVIVSGIFSSG
jgi:hypothetical protein